MWLLVLIGVIIYFVIVNAAEKSSGDKAYQSLVEREGIYLPRSYEREKELWSEIWENWYRGDKSLFPNEYIGYFASVENKALYSYIGALRDMQLVMEGFSPVDNNRVKPETYNSIKNFDIRWGDRIRAFNIKAAEEAAARVAEQAERQIVQNREKELWSEIYENWCSGDRSLFPNEYIGYFASIIGGDAMNDYMGALRDMQLVMEGFKIKNYYWIKPETYDPIRSFELKWGDRIRAFNIEEEQEQEALRIKEEQEYEALRATIARNVSYYTGAPLDLDTVECLKRRPNNESQT